MTGFWTYEFCHSRAVKQFHQSETQRKEFVLGRQSQSAKSRILSVNDTTVYSYLSLSLGDGTICDLNAKPREVVVDVLSKSLFDPGRFTARLVIESTLGKLQRRLRAATVYPCIHLDCAMQALNSFHVPFLKKRRFRVGPRDFWDNRALV